MVEPLRDGTVEPLNSKLHDDVLECVNTLHVLQCAGITRISNAKKGMQVQTQLPRR